MISKTYVQTTFLDAKLCQCGNFCDNIGDESRIGFRKEFCCECVSIKCNCDLEEFICRQCEKRYVKEQCAKMNNLPNKERKELIMEAVTRETQRLMDEGYQSNYLTHGLFLPRIYRSYLFWIKKIQSRASPSFTFKNSTYFWGASYSNIKYSCEQLVKEKKLARYYEPFDKSIYYCLPAIFESFKKFELEEFNK